MKRLIQRAVGFFGYEIRRKAPRDPDAGEVEATSLDAFTVQRELIHGVEPVIFDIGAHVGYVTKKYRDLFPLASIYSFEPFPDSFEQLRRNTTDDSRTSVYDFAVSDKRDVVILHANEYPVTNSLLPTDDRGSFYWGEGRLETRARVKVNSTTIDAFCAEHAISRIDILKLDIQGAEFVALNGAKEMLSSKQVSLIYSEVIMAPTYEHQHKLHEYLGLLDSFGYELFDFYSPVRRGMQLIQTNILLVGGDIRPRRSSSLEQRMRHGGTWGGETLLR